MLAVGPNLLRASGTCGVRFRPGGVGMCCAGLRTPGVVGNEFPADVSLPTNRRHCGFHHFLLPCPKAEKVREDQDKEHSHAAHGSCSGAPLSARPVGSTWKAP